MRLAVAPTGRQAGCVCAAGTANNMKKNSARGRQPSAQSSPTLAPRAMPHPNANGSYLTKTTNHHRRSVYRHAQVGERQMESVGMEDSEADLVKNRTVLDGPKLLALVPGPGTNDDSSPFQVATSLNDCNQQTSTLVLSSVVWKDDVDWPESMPDGKADEMNK
eukprot:scaffold576629_cov31-Prasinocladus_malaysianus.AAC.2